MKTTVIRMAFTMAHDLKPFNVAFGVTEKNWREGIKKDKFFAFSETPHYIGRAIVALASDPDIMQKTGQTLATWDLAQVYGFTDIDGTQPHWQRNYEKESGGR